MKAVRTIDDYVPPRNRTLGWQVLDWTAEYLLQPDGPTAGTHWEFTAEQAKIVLRWYQLDDQGRFVFRRGAIRRSKGTGKSPFAAAVAAAELAGPCRFGGWDADGNPVAIPHPSPLVQIAATNLDQTRNVMALFASLFSSEALDEYSIEPLKTVVYANGGKAMVESVTASPRALEGRRASLVVCDESQVWLESNDGHAMAEAIRRNLAKSRDGSARSLELSNAWLPGEGSVAEKTFAAWQADPTGIMYDSLEAPPVEDLSDTDRLRDALLVARGDAVWLDVDRLAAEIADPGTPASVSRRYYLNQVVAVGAERYVDPAAWDQLADPDREIPDGAPVIVGFDGSFNNDSTAAVGVLVAPTPHLFVVGHWQVPAPGEEVDVLDVEAGLLEAGRRWKVLEMAADPYRWARSLAVLYDHNLPVTNFPQTAQRMSPATSRFSDMVATGELTHSGDPRLREHLLNAVVVTDHRGRRIQKASKKSPRKIDLAVAALMALDRYVNSEDVARELRRQERKTPHGL